MRHTSKILFLALLLASPAFAQMKNTGKPMAPQAPKAADYPDSEIRSTLEWRELVDKVNRDRMHPATGDAMQNDMSGTMQNDMSEMQPQAGSMHPAMSPPDQSE